MLAFASMDAISKWLVADYPIGQLMWIRYGIFCLFAWFVVRRQGLATAARTRRPWLQAVRALVAVIESAVFVLAFRYLPLADTHALAATSPLIVIALGVALPGREGRRRALARGGRRLHGRAADRAAGLSHARLAAAAAGAGRAAMGRLPDPDAALRAHRHAAHHPGLVGLRGVRRHDSRRSVAMAMAGRHGLGADGRRRQSSAPSPTMP